MSVLLTHIGEAVTQGLLEATPAGFLEQTFGRKPISLFRELPLNHFHGKSFDGMGRVDLVAQISEREAIPIEVKLGVKRMTKGRIDQWLDLQGDSHKGTRWRGNMIYFLDRFDGLEVTNANDGSTLRLSHTWYLVLRESIYKKLCNRGLLSRLKRAKIIVFEELVRQVGAETFNEVVRRQFPENPYDKWNLNQVNIKSQLKNENTATKF